MDNKFVQAKNYQPWTDYHQDTYIDAKDSVNHWCVGQIVDVDLDKNMIKVHFEGWSNRYDEWVKKTAQKVGPFRRHTEGYTGQKRCAFREHFKISLTYHQTMEKKVQDTIKEEFKNFETPIQVTQFIRGDLYFYVDSLISMISVISNEELPMIFMFMQDVFKLILKWMEIFPQYLSSYQEALHHSQLYLVNMDAAIAMCGPELFGILEKCFGGCSRCSKFFQKFSSEQFQTEGPNEFAAKDKIKNNGLICSFLNSFGNMGGFEKLLNFITFDIKDNKDKMVKGCPFTLTMNLLRAFSQVFEIADRQYSISLSESICSAIMYRLDNLSENEIKELDKDILRGIIDLNKEYMMVIQPSEADKVSELKELQIAQKYLRCPFFEKRVRGINELKDIYHRASNAQFKNRANSDQFECTKWLNLEKYSQWLINQQIIEFIFVENPHVELIKRSYDIMSLLASQEQYFSAQMVEMLWVCASEKHEDIVRATLDIIKDLALNMPLERIQQVSTKLRCMKDHEFDEKLVMFLKQFTINTLKNIRNRQAQLNKGTSGGMKSMMSKQKEIRIDDSKYIDLTLFWQIFQDQNKVSQKVKDLALISLIEILSETNEKEQKDLFTMMAIENIRKCSTFYSSIVFLKKILTTYPQDILAKNKSSSSQVLTIAFVLQEIFKKNDLFEMILTNLKVYLQQAHEFKMKLGVTPTQGEKLQSLCLGGFMSHEDFIDVVMSFIQFLIMNSRVSLSFSNVEQMFQLLVTKAVTEHESNALFNFITKENEQSKSISRKFLLDDKVRNEVFQKIFCSNKYLNFEKMNIRGFNCFKRLFLIVNEEEKVVEIKKDRVYTNNLNQLQGLDSLWDIAIQSEVQQVREISKDFVVDLYLNIKSKTPNQKRQTNDLFPSKCLSIIKSHYQRPDYQLNCLKLIKSYISRFDGDHILEEDMSQYPANEIKPVEVTLSPDKANIVVKIHHLQKMWQLKRKMANAFKMKLSEFYIKTKQGPLTDDVYDEQISEYKIEKIHIQRVNPEEMEKEFPRFIIGYNSDYLSMLLGLFKTGKEECKREVLSLLEILPINLDVKMQMRDHICNKIQLGEKNLQDWMNLFQCKNKDLPVTCYYLMALEDLIVPKKNSPLPDVNQNEIQTKNEFCLKLIGNGGFHFLFELMKSIDKSQIERDIIKTKILGLLLRFFSHFFRFKQVQIFKNAVTPQILEVLIQSTLSIVENYINGVFSQQVKGVGEDRDVRVLKNEQAILIYSLTFLTWSFVYNYSSINQLYNYPNIVNIFRIALIDLDQIRFIHENFYKEINEICIKLDPSPQIQIKPSFFFMSMFLDKFIEHALTQKKGEKTATFFMLMNEILMKTEIHKDLSQIKPAGQLINEITSLIINREIKEISARDEDVPLQGLFSFLKNIFFKLPEARDSFQGKNDLLQYLIHDCLFHKETRGQLITKAKAMPPKCKNTKTREECLQLLNEICTNNEQGIYILIRYLKNHICETFWRTPRKSDWNITVHQQERSLTGFVGLKNIGCICYMNSIMQQLFMIPSFKKSILEVEDSNVSHEPPEENVLHQLKMIFGGLMEIESQYFNPKNFCAAFKDIDGSSIDPMIQKDVDEFFNMAMDRIENLVKGKKEDKVIKNLFQGVLANEFICKGCPHYSEREEPFMTISLQVKNKHSIKESLESFVEGEMLEGDNAYHCEKCEKKVNTLKRCCIKRMPNVMFLVLKRFEFNFDTMTKFKINDYCEFPMQINMKQYCQETLAKKDLLKEMEDKNLTQDDLSEEKRAILDKEIPSKYYDYNLKGTVIHIGTAEQGHYISYIQDRERDASRWFEFNDNIVREFNPEDIPNEAFGGEDESFMANMNINQMQGSGLNEQILSQMQHLKTKIKNAYILIYERDDAIDMEKFNEFMDDPNINSNKQDISLKYEQCKLPKTTSAQIQIPPSIHDFILEKNKKFWLSKFIFNKSYIESVLKIFELITIEENMNYIEAREVDLQAKLGYQFEMFKFFTTFFLTTVIRANQRGRTVPNFMQIIKKALKYNVALSVWLLESFSVQGVIREFLIDSPITDMKRFVAGLLKTAMQTVYKFEEENINKYIASFDSGIVDYVLQTQQGLIKNHKVIDNRIAVSKAGDPNINSGSCQNLNIITLGHHNQKLPILIMMINSFIHLNVSPHYFKQQGLCGQFYQVFAHFSELGEQARLYLLKCKTVGRMLDLFFNPDIQGNKQQPQVSEKFRSQSLELIPIFQLDKELYIQSNLEKQDAKISALEKKQSLNDAIQPQMFLLYTVSKLSRSCMYVKDAGQNPLANDKLNFQLDQDELAMITNHDNNAWWIFSDKKVTRNAVADMYAHMSFQNKEFSLMLLSNLNIGLQKSFFDEMKLYERALIKQLLIKDQYQQDRTKKALSNLQEIMKLNVTSYKEMDSLIDILYKICQRSIVAVEMVSKSQGFVQFIERWQKENPHFPLNQNKTRLFKAGIIQWPLLKNMQINETVCQKVAAYTKDRMQRLVSLINKETPVNETAYDSDDDLYGHVFEQKERVDFIDQMNNVQTGIIDFALEEMVKCMSDASQQSQKQVIQWIGTEQDTLAPGNTMVGSEKKRMQHFYQQLYKSIQNN